MNVADELAVVIAFEKRKEESLKKELRKCITVQRMLRKELEHIEKRNSDAMS